MVEDETSVTRLRHLREEIESGAGALSASQAYLLADVCEALDMSDADTRRVMGDAAYMFVTNPLTVVATNDDVAGELFTLESARDRLGRRVMLDTDRDPYLPRGIVGVVSALRRRGPESFYVLGVAWGREGSEALLTWVTRLEYDAWLEELPATVTA